MFAKDMVEAVAKVLGWEHSCIVEANGETVTMKGDKFRRHHVYRPVCTRTRAASSGASMSPSTRALASFTRLPAMASTTTGWHEVRRRHHHAN